MLCRNFINLYVSSTNRILQEGPNIQTIQDYISNSLEISYHTEHQNLLISQTGNYSQQHSTKNQGKVT